MLQARYRELLRRLALGDEGAVASAMRGEYTGSPLLDDKTAALVRLACVVAADSKGPAFFAGIDECHAAGAENVEIVKMVNAISPVLGGTRARQVIADVRTVDEIRT